MGCVIIAAEAIPFAGDEGDGDLEGKGGLVIY
jgi:hypothetical protein